MQKYLRKYIIFILLSDFVFKKSVAIIRQQNKSEIIPAATDYLEAAFLSDLEISCIITP